MGILGNEKSPFNFSDVRLRMMLLKRTNERRD
jgi:hypothetical protein